ncbi:Ff.00g135490.m01.CDS01 [Fusarium sp. VM40]|nr:Ff.00g135490.m01.CDS01 [Fusarium sp. VM40]
MAPNNMEKTEAAMRPPSVIKGSVQDISDKACLKTITRKVDYHLVPLMLVCYFLQFLDKALINYANIMGLSTSLNFQGNDFSWMATAFFIGFAVAEFPQGFLIQKFPVSKVLGINVVLWGTVICCSAAAQNFPGITAARTLLGMFEAVISPSLIMITSQWYTRRQATPRTGIWYCGLGIGQTIGGLISYAAQHGSLTSSFQGWRIMFVSVGAFNVLVGILVTFWMPSSIKDAKFLTEHEQVVLQDALNADQGGNGAKTFHAAGIWEAVEDLQVWLLFLNTILIVIPSGIITTFSATLIRGFGYSPKQAALLNMPSGVVSVAATLLSTFAILYGFPRWLGLCLLMVPTLIGAGLMSFYSDSQAGSLVGIYLINFDVAPLALIYALVGANVQGYTKKVTTNAIVAIGFSIANIIGPQTFQVRDAPDYISAKITVFCVCGGSVVVSILIRVLYGVRNGKGRVAQDSQLGQVLGSQTPETLTDRNNPNFFYVY